MDLKRIFLIPLSKLDNAAALLPWGVAMASGIWFVIAKIILTLIGKFADTEIAKAIIPPVNKVQDIDPKTSKQVEKQIYQDFKEKRESSWQAEQKRQYYEKNIELRKKYSKKLEDYLKKIREN